MTDQFDIIDQYYDMWKTKSFNPDLFTDDFLFTAPLSQANGCEEFFDLLRKRTELVEVERFDLHSKFVNDRGDACTFYDLVTIKPFKGTTHYAEYFTFENNKIKSVRVIVDPRKWIDTMQKVTL